MRALAFSKGRLKVQTIADAVPAGAFYNGGVAYAADGSLYVYYGSIPSNARSVGGVRVTNDGAVIVSPRGAAIATAVGGLPIDAKGQLVVRDYGTVAQGSSGLPVNAKGEVCVWDETPEAIGSVAASFYYGQGITGASAVSQWNDQSGNGRHLKQATATNKPTRESDDSITCDGVDNYLKCDAFTLNQPTTVYFLGKQITWTSTDRLYDGDGNGTMVMQQITATPNLRITAGSAGPANAGLALDTYGVLAAVFNGASSLFSVNAGSAVTGDVGANNAGGFTVAASGNAALFAHANAKEVLIYAAAHAASVRLRMIRREARIGAVAL